MSELRDYQREVLQQAESRNVVAYLPTGSGKTLIAVSLIRYLADTEYTLNQGVYTPKCPVRSKIAFLAPTVPLVKQQGKIISSSSFLKTSLFFGCEYDHYDAGMWIQELASTDVMVMTPQILVNALTHGFIKIEHFILIAFDEAHHCMKNHPYNKVMSEYHHTHGRRPKIFGMTASPAISGGSGLGMKLLKLQANLDCKILPFENDSLNGFYTHPNQELVRYSRSLTSMEEPDTFIIMLQSLCSKYQFTKRIGVADANILSSSLPLPKELRKIVYGLESFYRSIGSFGISVLINDFCILIEKKIDFLNMGFAKFRKDHTMFLRELSSLDFDNTLSDRLRLLHDLLRNYEGDEEFRAIVFVEQRIIAYGLAHYLDATPSMSFINAVVCVGKSSFDPAGNSIKLGSDKEQTESLNAFRSGAANLLIATSVAEEGLDIQACSLVVRFDIPKTIRAFVQSRGRARKPSSRYVIFVSESEFKNIASFERDEVLIEHICRQPKDTSRSFDLSLSEYLYIVPSTQATLNLDNSIGLLYSYWQSTQVDVYFTTQPCFQEHDVFGWTLRLPPPSTLHNEIFTGDSSENDTRVCKQIAAFKACLLLYQEGELSDYLLPITKDDLIRKYFSSGISIKSRAFEKIEPFALFTYSLTLSSASSLRGFTTLGLLSEFPFHEQILNTVHRGFKVTYSLQIPALSLNLSGVVDSFHNSILKECALPPYKKLYNNSTIRIVALLSDGSLDISSMKSHISIDRMQYSLCFKQTSHFESVLTLKDLGIVGFPLNADGYYRNARVLHSMQYPSSLSSIELERLLTPNESSQSPLFKVSRCPKNVVLINCSPEASCDRSQQYSYVDINYFLISPLCYSAWSIVVILPSLFVLIENTRKAQSLCRSFSVESSSLKPFMEALSIPKYFTFNYERLESLGDSILKLCACQLFYKSFPGKREGFLTTLKSHFVSNKYLCTISKEMKLYTFISLPFFPDSWNEHFTQMNTSDFSEKMHADLLESFIGALYSQFGFQETFKYLVFDLGLFPNCIVQEFSQAHPFVAQPIHNPAYLNTVNFLSSILNYEFNNPSLALESLLHISRGDFSCYQRLEFLGDALLDAVVTDAIFSHHSMMTPFEITLYRSTIVSNHSIGFLSYLLSISKLLIHQSSNIVSETTSFTEGILFSLTSDVFRDWKHLLDVVFENPPPKYASDVFEAILGAMYVDCSYDFEIGKKLITSLLEDIISPSLNSGFISRSPIPVFLETIQRDGFMAEDVSVEYHSSTNLFGECDITPVVHVLPNRLFQCSQSDFSETCVTCNVYFQAKLVGSGNANCQKSAKALAFKDACRWYNDTNLISPV